MKVIDLLNKIANGEIEDKKIFNIIFSNRLYRRVYYDKEEPNCMECLKNVSDDCPIYDDLSFNTEIVDIPISKLYINNELQYDLTQKEDNKIEKLNIGEITDDKLQGLVKSINLCNKEIQDKINEIIAKVKGDK